MTQTNDLQPNTMSAAAYVPTLRSCEALVSRKNEQTLAVKACVRRGKAASVSLHQEGKRKFHGEKS